MPEISVIMNCRNGEKYLPEALQSVASQTCQNFEIIFWDNCSTDNSAAIASGFGPKLRYFQSDQPLPLGAARNKAIDVARGEFIAFLDCDDLWEPAKLAEQLIIMKSRPNIGLVTGDTVIFNEKGPLYKLFNRAVPARGMVFDDLILRQWVSMSSAFLRRSALDAVAEAPGRWFDETLNVCEEADLFYRIANQYELDYVDAPLAWWRVHGQNTTFQKFGQFAAETEAILAKHRRIYPDYDANHGNVAQILTKRARFQQAISLWQANRGQEAREALAPQKNQNIKYALFYFLTFLPGSLFAPLSKIYFSLPGWLRR